MHLIKNKEIIESLLPQRDIMLMIDEIPNHTSKIIYAKPKISNELVDEYGCIMYWALLECMGQCAELLWRTKGISGMGLLVKISNFDIPSKPILIDNNLLVSAEIDKVYNNIFSSITKFHYNTNKYISAYITHCFLQ